MADEAAETGNRQAARDMKAELDERKIARAVAVGLPIVTVTMASVAGVLIGAPMAILILAAGLILGVIGLFWASLRILSGDAALPPELEALDATAHAVDALSSRKKMLLRALKDLDNERALGKLEADDHEQLSQTYRAELRDVLARIDASLAPHRPKAEDIARAHLVKAGLADDGYRGAPWPKEATAPDSEEDLAASDEDESKPAKKPGKKAERSEPAKEEPRVACPKCETSNEVDATFCKKCGTSLAKTVAEDEDEDDTDAAGEEKEEEKEKEKEKESADEA